MTTPAFFMQPMVLDKVKETLEPLISGMGAEVVDISYRREKGEMVLRVLVDKPGGITLGECAGLNNKLSEALDRENIIEEHYVIEVSSPGLDRPIKTKEEFGRAMGKVLNVSTYMPFEKKRNFQGTLMGLGENYIVLEDEDGVSRQIPIEKIAGARLHVVF